MTDARAVEGGVSTAVRLQSVRGRSAAVGEVLGVRCPRCDVRLTARRLWRDGLRCDCGVDVLKLADACTAAYGLVTYVIESERMQWRCGGPVVRQMGGTRRLSEVLRACNSRRGEYEEYIGKRRTLESVMAEAGDRVRVALFGSEVTLRLLLGESPGGEDPERWRFRGVVAVPAGATACGSTGAGGLQRLVAVEYDVRGCLYVHAAALALEGSERRARLARGNAAYESESEVLMADVGLLRLQPTRSALFDRGLRRQGVVVEEVIARPSSDYRVGWCSRQARLRGGGYCTCAVPCALRWTLEGAPRIGERACRSVLLETDDDVTAEMVDMNNDDGIRRDEYIEAVIMDRRGRAFYGGVGAYEAVGRGRSDFTCGVVRRPAGWEDHVYPGDRLGWSWREFVEASVVETERLTEYAVSSWPQRMTESEAVARAAGVAADRRARERQAGTARLQAVARELRQRYRQR